MKVAFVDRDGTINEDYPDEVWRNISEPALLCDSVEALRGIQGKGYQIIIVTNQYVINDGVITLSQYRAFTEKLLRRLNDGGVDILDIFYCPHSKRENCDCCKPKTGLVDRAVEKYPDIDLDRSFVVGDSPGDVGLGNRLGVKTFGINVRPEAGRFLPLRSLLDVLQYI